jgi:hypothetical protein
LALGCAVAGCEKTPDPDGELIAKPARLAGGDCLGPAALPDGWRLFAQTLPDAEPGRALSLVLLHGPEPKFKSFSGQVKHDGLFDVQIRDTKDIPVFAGTRSFDDVLKDNAIRGGWAKHTEAFGPLVLTSYKGGDNAEIFVANDPGGTLLTCQPPGGHDEATCKVTTAWKDGRYKLISAFTYDRRGQFRQMAAEAEAKAQTAFVPCPSAG